MREGLRGTRGARGSTITRYLGVWQARSAPVHRADNQHAADDRGRVERGLGHVIKGAFDALVVKGLIDCVIQLAEQWHNA